MTLEHIFGIRKPIIGMVHLKKLPGQVGHRGISYVVNKAIEDALVLQRGGVDAICIENWEDESTTPFVDWRISFNLESIIREIAANTQIIIGLNILPNDYCTAFRIAENLWLASGRRLRFVWIDVMVDYVKTDFTYSKAPSFEVRVDLDDLKRHQRELSRGVALFASVHPKHYILLEPNKSLEESARQAILNGANAIVITKATGIAPDVATLKRIKKFVGDLWVIFR